MSGEPVLGWDSRVLIAAESVFGTPLAPASSQAIETVNFGMGPVEQGQTRAQKDKTQGRGMTSKFIQGRVQPIQWTLETSVKSRAANTTVPKESVLYKSAGLVETVGGSSVAYSMSSNPTVPSMCGYRILGTGATAYEAEQGRGGIVKTLSWMGGDQELMLKAAGEFIGKYHQGYLSSVTLADGSVTTISGSVEQAHRISLGYYQIESEIVLVTAVNYATGDITITRATLSSSGAAHTAMPMYPYVPSLTLAGSPIPEPNVTITIDSVAIRCTKFHVDLTTGIALLPGETGSAYVQGLKAVRYDMKSTYSLIMKREDVALLGKATQRKLCAITIVCGTGAGSIVTFSMPYSEVEPFTVPDTNNDVVAVDVSFRHRDSSGNDMATVTLT